MKNSSRSGVVVGSVFGRSSVLGALTCFVSVPALANDFAQTSVYRGKIDSPYISTELVVNDFEASADTVGVGISGVVARVSGSSVDADDSALDGTGAGGHSLALGSYFPVFAPGSAIFSFQSKLLGGAPTNAGVVITAANGLENEFGAPIDVPVMVTVALTDVSIVSQVFPVRSADESATDDVFIGFASATGILSLSVQCEIPIKIDHLQFALPAQLIPPYIRNDFDGDGKADICWYNRTTGGASVWKMNGLVRESNANLSPSLPARSVVLGTGDLNGDQRTDVIWQNPTTGVVSAILLDSNVSLGSGALAPAVSKSWKFLGAGDIDGDGNGDCLFRNSSTGLVVAWLMDGLTRVGNGTVGNASGLTFLGMGDFDGDRKQDLLWRASGGRIIGWKLDGLAGASAQQIANSTVMSSRLRVAGIGDLNSDGKDDVIWRRTGTGAVSAWLMNGLTLEAAGSIAASSPASWILVGSSDLDGDGKSDLLWRQKNNGDTHAWLMDGFTKVSNGFIRNASTSWTPIK